MWQKPGRKRRQIGGNQSEGLRPERQEEGR